MRQIVPAAAAFSGAVRADVVADVTPTDTTIVRFLFVN